MSKKNNAPALRLANTSRGLQWGFQRGLQKSIVKSAGSLLGLCVLLIGVAAFVPQATAEQRVPKVLVEDFQNLLLDVMRRAEDMTTRQRYDALLPTVEQTFHLGLMTRFVTDGHWQDGTAEERADMTKAFTRMNLATLATLFDGYSGQVFVTDGVESASQGRVLVKTRIVSPDGDFHSLTYVAKELSGRWWLIDVIVNNSITELATRRSEYRSTLQAGGLPALAGLLNSKADSLLNP
ncbi:MAG: ABC transporter substrate-binding protein [Magnetovibrionaceae bacterium]